MTRRSYENRKAIVERQKLNKEEKKRASADCADLHGFWEEEQEQEKHNRRRRTKERQEEKATDSLTWTDLRRFQEEEEKQITTGIHYFDGE